MSRVEQVLADFSDSSVTVKLLSALYKTIPGSPEFKPVASMDDAVRSLYPAATPTDIARARAFAVSADEVGDILWMSNVMDAGDKGYAVVTGLMTAWKLFKGQGSQAFENDNQQRNDAVLKALGLSYMIFKAYPGSIAEKARAFRDSPTGKLLAVYYGAVEVALPFADNAVGGGAGGLSSLLSSQAAAQSERLAQMSSGHDIGQAKEMLTEVTSQLQSVAGQASNYVKPITQAIGPYLPGMGSLGNATDKAAGAIAGAADVLPVYRYLGARLAAEAAARRAMAS